MLDRHRLDDFIEPVCIRVQDRVVLIHEVLELDIVVVRRCTRNGQFVVVCVGIEHCVGHVHQSGRLLQTEVVCERYPWGLVVLSSLGGHKDDTVGRTGSVNRSGCVFQHVDALDFISRQTGKFVGTSRNTVDYNKRRVVTEGTPSPDEHRRIVVSRFSAPVAHNHAGKPSCKALRQIDSRTFGQGFSGSLSHGSGQGKFALRTVTDSDGFFKELAVRFEYHVYLGTAVYGNFQSLVTYTGNDENCIVRRFDFILSVNVCGNSCHRPLYHYSGSDDTFSCGRRDNTFHSDVFLRICRRTERQKRKYRQYKR